MQTNHLYKVRQRFTDAGLSFPFRPRPILLAQMATLRLAKDSRREPNASFLIYYIDLGLEKCLSQT